MIHHTKDPPFTLLYHVNHAPLSYFHRRQRGRWGGLHNGNKVRMMTNGSPVVRHACMYTHAPNLLPAPTGTHVIPVLSNITENLASRVFPECVSCTRGF